MANKAKFYLSVMAACWNEAENIGVQESYTYHQGDDASFVLCQTLKSVYEYVMSLDEDKRKLRITSDIVLETCTDSEDYDENDDEHIHPDEAESEQWILGWDEETQTISASFWSHGYSEHNWFDGHLEYDGSKFKFGGDRHSVPKDIFWKTSAIK